MSEKYYLVSKKELKRLLKRDAKLDILEWDGVDNWCGYMNSFPDYIADYFEKDVDDEELEDLDLEDIAEDRLKKYGFLGVKR